MMKIADILHNQGNISANKKLIPVGAKNYSGQGWCHAGCRGCIDVSLNPGHNTRRAEGHGPETVGMAEAQCGVCRNPFRYSRRVERIVVYQIVEKSFGDVGIQYGIPKHIGDEWLVEKQPPEPFSLLRSNSTPAMK